MSKRKADAPPQVDVIPEGEDSAHNVNALPKEEENTSALANNQIAVEETAAELGPFWVLLSRAGYIMW